MSVARESCGEQQLAADHASIGKRLDHLPVTRLHLAIVFTCACGFTFDLIEIALGSVLSAVFSTPPHAVPADLLAWLLAAVYVGAIIGAPAFGRLADVRGRRSVMTAMLFFLAMTSLAAAFSRNITWLIIARGLSGLVLGAYPPLMIAFLTDLLPPRRRGLLIAGAVAIASLGPVGIIFLVRWLTPHSPLGVEAWRWAFCVGGSGAALVGALFWRLPESPRWLATKGRFMAAAMTLSRFERSRAVTLAGRGPLPPSSVVFQPARVASHSSSDTSRPGWRERGKAVVLAGIFLLSPWATTGFPLLSGAAFAAKGLRIADTLYYVGLAMLGQFAGGLLGLAVIDRTPRRVLLVLCAAAMVVSGPLFGSSSDPSTLLVSSTVFTLAAALYITVVNVYASESFPTSTRAVAGAALWALSRGVSALTPLVLLPLLHVRGVMAMCWVMAAVMAATIVLTVAFAPGGRTGMAIE
jgi:putative MFS transporter